MNNILSVIVLYNYDAFRIYLFNDAEKCIPGFLLRAEEDKFAYIMSSDNLTIGHCIVL